MKDDGLVRKLSKPKKLTFSKVPKKMIVKWTRVEGATSYKVSYRKIGGKWKTKSTNKTKMTLSGMKKGKLYQFKVAAVKKETETTANVTGRYYVSVRPFKTKGGKLYKGIRHKAVKVNVK